MFLYIFTPVYLFLFLLPSHVQGISYAQELKLLDDLSKDYEKAIRPANNASTPTKVSLGLSILKVVELDIKKEVLVTRVWLHQKWTDQLLQWNPSEYGGVSSMTLPRDLVWLPDIGIIDDASEPTAGEEVNLDRYSVRLEANGTVTYIPKLVIKSHCLVDVAYYPFDTQQCQLIFGSRAYDGLQLELSMEPEIDFGNFHLNGELEVTETTQKLTHDYMPCCKDHYDHITFTLTLKRRPLYYIYTAIVPTILISLLSLASFRLPQDESEKKLSIGITVILVFNVMLWSINESLPHTSHDIPILGIYVLCVLILMVMSACLTVLRINVCKADSDSKVPRCLHVVFLTGLPAVLGVRKQKKRSKDSEEEKDNEWKQLADVVDQLFFWIFLILLFVATLVFLVILPLTN